MSIILTKHGTGVHPRVSGVLSLDLSAVSSSDGSSPRERGFVLRGDSGLFEPGFIPA